MSSVKGRILFMMSGSIAGFKACQVISRLVQDGYEVQAVVTKSTFEFVGRMTLEGLTGKKVLSDLWESGHAMDHIHLTRWADFAVLCPASANTMARFAHGLSEDLVSSMALAWPSDKAFWIIPAMNHQMLASPATQMNMQTLTTRGFKIAPTQSGSLACGEEGQGRMLEPDEILQFIMPVSRGRILVTAGATREPIDGIRFISNVSSGQTGATLTDKLSALGWEVTHLSGVGSTLPNRAAALQEFSSYQDLEEKLHRSLSSQDFAAVIHCAAVSDFSLLQPQTEVKLGSREELTLKLKPNAKILPHLKEFSRNKNICVVGFKLTLNSAPEEAARKILGSGVDAVIANEWSSVQADRARHPGTFICAKAVVPFDDLETLSAQLHDFILNGDSHGLMS